MCRRYDSPFRTITIFIVLTINRPSWEAKRLGSQQLRYLVSKLEYLSKFNLYYMLKCKCPLDVGSQRLTMPTLPDNLKHINYLSEVCLHYSSPLCIKVLGAESVCWLHCSGPTDNYGIHDVLIYLKQLSQECTNFLEAYIFKV